MTDDIEFGQLEESQPESGLRPDRNKHFAVVECGEIRADELPIFIDLDVLRDMEAHARENTRVELGGVMLGRQHVDLEGKPYVVITDSLRARHYEATKGSFKFTHDTWNQITRERNEFHNELEMVGWYHTHPGWGVFLSGMDLFICNNFFNRPLDVALVIDPCAGDRGWFQWSTDDPDKTEQTGGFFLMTNRHRGSELNYFSEFFSGQHPRIPDPRFNRPGFNEHTNATSSLEDNMVNVIDDRRGIFEFAIVSMLFLQLLVAGLIGWRLTKSDVETADKDTQQRIESLEKRLAEDEFQMVATVREQALTDVLKSMANQPGEEAMAQKYTEVATQNFQLQESLNGQLSRVRLEEMRNAKAANEIALRDTQMGSLEKELKDTAHALDESKADLKELKDQLGVTDEESAGQIPTWFWYTLSGAGLLAFGGFAGFFLNRVFVVDDEHELPVAENDERLLQETEPANITVTDKESAYSSNIK